jgi:hypothetical protein
MDSSMDSKMGPHGNSFSRPKMSKTSVAERLLLVWVRVGVRVRVRVRVSGRKWARRWKRMPFSRR